MIERINLLPARQRDRSAAGSEARWFLLALALAMALLVVMGTWEVVHRNALERRRGELLEARDRVQAEIQLASAAMGRINSLAGEKAALQARLEALGSVQRDRRSWSELLVRISRITPEGLWLTTLGSDQLGEGAQAALGLRFQGRALSHERISELLGALERDPSFQEVLLISTARGTYLERDVVDFTLSCRVRAL